MFLTVLHRLFVSGSDRQAQQWRHDYVIEGVDGLELHHMYRAMAWMGEELPESAQWAAIDAKTYSLRDLCTTHVQFLVFLTTFFTQPL